jgi:hypothetical protein
VRELAVGREFANVRLRDADQTGSLGRADLTRVENHEDLLVGKKEAARALPLNDEEDESARSRARPSPRYAAGEPG